LDTRYTRRRAGRGRSSRRAPSTAAAFCCSTTRSRGCHRLLWRRLFRRRRGPIACLATCVGSAHRQAPRAATHQAATSVVSSRKDTEGNPADAVLRVCQIIRTSRAVATRVDPTSQICSENPASSSRPIERNARNLRSTQRCTGGTTRAIKTRKLNKVIDLTIFLAVR
jgi:hypothetical protein